MRLLALGIRGNDGRAALVLLRQEGPIGIGMKLLYR